jgi:hypothetical protein
MTRPAPHRMTDQSWRVLVRFVVGLAGLSLFALVPGIARLGSARDGVAMLSMMCALSGVCRTTIALLRREQLGPAFLTSWDEAAGYYAVSVLARMFVDVMG